MGTFHQPLLQRSFAGIRLHLMIIIPFGRKVWFRNYLVVPMYMELVLVEIFKEFKSRVLHLLTVLPEFNGVQFRGNSLGVQIQYITPNGFTMCLLRLWRQNRENFGIQHRICSMKGVIYFSLTFVQARAICVRDRQ